VHVKFVGEVDTIVLPIISMDNGWSPLSPRPRPYGQVERSAFSVRSPEDKADFPSGLSASPRFLLSQESSGATVEMTPHLSGFLSVDFTNNLDTHPNPGVPIILSFIVWDILLK